MSTNAVSDEPEQNHRLLGRLKAAFVLLGLALAWILALLPCAVWFCLALIFDELRGRLKSKG